MASLCLIIGCVMQGLLFPPSGLLHGPANMAASGTFLIINTRSFCILGTLLFQDCDEAGGIPGVYGDELVMGSIRGVCVCVSWEESVVCVFKCVCACARERERRICSDHDYIPVKGKLFLCLYISISN